MSDTDQPIDPRVDVGHPGQVIGRSTVASMQAGLYFGYAAMCEGIIARIRAELGEAVRVVATGGLAETPVPVARTATACAMVRIRPG